MKNKILAKSRGIVSQLYDRSIRGAQYAEIHLNDDELTTEKEVIDMSWRIFESGLDVLSIHAPIGREYILESFGKEEAKKRMHLVSLLAQIMHQIHDEEVIIVVHHELSFEQLKEFGLMEGALDLIEELLDTYPNIKIAFENLSLVNLEENKLISRNSFYDSPVKIAKYMRSRLHTNRIGTVLDTCHALNAVRTIGALSKCGYNSEITLDNFFDAYIDTLFLIHFSNAINLGFEKNHGTLFTSDEDKLLLYEILNKIKEIEYEGLITLEVNEDDVDCAENFSSLRETLRQVEEGLL